LKVKKTLQLFASTANLIADRFAIAELGAVQGQSFGTSELPEEAKQRLAEIAQTAMLKAETLTKKDWQYWIQGAFSSTVTSLELTEAQIQEVVALIWLAFCGLFLQA
jgi:hypothetical protein